MDFEIINFRAKDGIKLDGFLCRSRNKTKKVLIQVHGMTSNCFKKRNMIIANVIKELGIDTLSFDNRGSHVVKYISDGNRKFLGGTAYENIEECEFDIVGAIEYALSLGYTEIYLQGHSLGSTKIVYTYNRLQERNSNLLAYIKGIILLSLVDIPGTINMGTNEKYIKLAEEKEKNGESIEIMPIKSFIHPMSVKTYLKYIKYNEDIDFARYEAKNEKFEILNKIKSPLFMRWGNVNELIKQDAKELTEFMNNKIKNDYKDINYIDGADHGYHGKEQILAGQIKDFLKKCI